MSKSVSLKYQFNKGEKFTYRLTTNSSNDQLIQADSTIKAKSSQDMTTVLDFTVVDVDKDNTTSLNVNINAIKVDAEMNGQKVSYDSKANNSPQIKAQFMQYETLTNSPFLINVDAKGSVTKIAKLDNIINKITAAQPKGTKINAQQKSALEKNISQALQPIVQLLFKEVSDKPVAKDSTWSRSYPGNLAVFSLINTAKYKLEDFVKYNGSTAAKIKADLTVQTAGNKQGSENGMNYNFSDPKITGGGIILFSVDKGKVVKSETATNVEIKVIIEAKDANQKTKKTTRVDITSNKNIVELL
jgi:hypothetical protein